MKGIVANQNKMLRQARHEQTWERQAHPAAEFSIHRPRCATHYPSPNSSTPKYQHILYTRTVLVLEMSTRGEIRGNMVHRGSLSWDARLVILQCQFLNIWWAPLCHLPVHSVCPKLWLPPHSIFYNDILAAHGTLMKHALSTACRGISCMFASLPLHG